MVCRGDTPHETFIRIRNKCTGQIKQKSIQPIYTQRIYTQGAEPFSSSFSHPFSKVPFQAVRHESEQDGEHR